MQNFVMIALHSWMSSYIENCIFLIFAHFSISSLHYDQKSTEEKQKMMPPAVPVLVGIENSVKEGEVGSWLLVVVECGI